MIGGSVFEEDSPKRSSFGLGRLTASGMLIASVATAGALLSRASSAGMGRSLDFANDGLTKSDIAILRFLATIELIECDLWQQYEELGGLTEGAQNSYQLALQFLDHNSSRQISDNCICEVSHATFLNEFLKSEGAEPVDLNRFHILSGSSAAGARDVGRLTSLMHLNLDTLWHIRYRPEDTRELDSPIPRVMRLVNRPSIPRSEEDLSEPEHIQAIANTAAFHFGYIQRSVSSLYSTLCRKGRRAKVLKIALGIGGQEMAQFLGWIDFGSRVISGTPFSLDNSRTPIEVDSETLSSSNNTPRKQGASSHGDFIWNRLPIDSVIRRLDERCGGAAATVNCFTENGLFVGQPEEFLKSLQALASEADDAMSA
jgi:hypothetical protein